MSVAYTPGLRVTASATIRRERRLPMRGEVLVSRGQQVGAQDIVARAEMPGNLHTLRAAQVLHLEPQEVPSYLTKQTGEAVEQGEVVAETRGLWGLFRSQVRSPVAGTLEEISPASGHIRIREHPRRVEVGAHIAGRVAEVIADEGAIIEAQCALVQGIFGVGGERRGELRLATSSPEAALRPEDVGDCRGCVLVAGAAAGVDAINAAADAGAVGLVVGAVGDEVLRSYLGYELGVAITGQEEVPLTLVLTEGFGSLAMAHRTWNLLQSVEGGAASVDGATQIRAGVIRPEVIVPHEREAGVSEDESLQCLSVGSRVRVIRAPNFGALGRITSLPAELTEIETESRVRIAMVRLDSGDEVRVPRANLEIIQA